MRNVNRSIIQNCFCVEQNERERTDDVSNESWFTGGLQTGACVLCRVASEGAEWQGTGLSLKRQKDINLPVALCVTMPAMRKDQVSPSQTILR